jgi:hypothetical protein
MPTEDGKMTKEERIEMLRKRIKADGTPFAKNTNRRRKTINANGLEAALSVLDNDVAKVKLLQSLGVDGRAALRGLVESKAEFKYLAPLAFPRAHGAGRDYSPTIKTTKIGAAIVTGFDPGWLVDVQRNDDGTVLLRPQGRVEATV